MLCILNEEHGVDEQFSIEFIGGAKASWNTEYHNGVATIVAHVSLDHQSFKIVISRDDIKTDVLYCDSAQEVSQIIQILSYAQHVRQRLWDKFVATQNINGDRRIK